MISNSSWLQGQLQLWLGSTDPVNAFHKWMYDDLKISGRSGSIAGSWHITIRNPSDNYS
jgi:hypothetical protein